MDEPQHILLCEPQCWGFSHASFNAGLVAAVRLAFPESPITFMGEPGHLAHVQDELQACRVSVPDVSWKAMAIPMRGSGFLRVMRAEHEWTHHMLNETRVVSHGLIVLCSLTNSGLLLLKRAMHGKGKELRVLAIPHGVLGTLGVSPEGLWSWATSMRQIMRLPHPPRLQYIALGEPILEAIREASPQLAGRFSLVRPPCLPRDMQPSEPKAGQPVTFGWFGVTGHSKGFDTYVQIARGVRAACPGARFLLVGFEREHSEEAARWVEGTGVTPLSQEEYARRAAEVTYSVWTGEPSHYRFTASATFLDALFFVKPSIYLRNPYVEYYAGHMGDIGYACDGLDEMTALITGLAEGFPSERYARQCEQIRAGQNHFLPVTVAPQLRTAAEHVLFA